ncbi:hypothetical protein DL95DRAFT_495660 [Leptodontidium sp. 2 PMI_412]|nr:hypothetical protein DL95DRAFT_495660 [Leptodontidium sp. 2 PMI_412]
MATRLCLFLPPLILPPLHPPASLYLVSLFFQPVLYTYIYTSLCPLRSPFFRDIRTCAWLTPSVYTRGYARATATPKFVVSASNENVRPAFQQNTISLIDNNKPVFSCQPVQQQSTQNAFNANLDIGITAESAQNMQSSNGFGVTTQYTASRPGQNPVAANGFTATAQSAVPSASAENPFSLHGLDAAGIQQAIAAELIQKQRAGGVAAAPQPVPTSWFTPQAPAFVPSSSTQTSAFKDAGSAPVVANPLFGAAATSHLAASINNFASVGEDKVSGLKDSRWAH